MAHHIYRHNFWLKIEENIQWKKTLNENDLWWKRRHPLMEDDFERKQPLMEDYLWWKMTFDQRRVLGEENTTFGGGKPLKEDNI